MTGISEYKNFARFHTGLIEHICTTNRVKQQGMSGFTMPRKVNEDQSAIVYISLEALYLWFLQETHVE